MKASGCNAGVIATVHLLVAGCSTVEPPAGRDAHNDYVPHKDIGAKPGSADSPDTGWNSLIVGILQALLPAK